MPKLIVYVKADTWRRVEAGYGKDAASLMRNLSVEAIENLVGGLTETGDGSTAKRVSPQVEKPVSASAAPPVSVSPDDHFKPDFK